MKLKLSIILLSIITLLVSCDMSTSVDAESVSITATTTKFKVSETSTLSANVLPSDASQTVTWSSSDDTIATVSSSGVVTAVSAGIVTITAESGSKSDTQKLYIGYEQDFTNPGNWSVGTSNGKTTSITGGKLNISISDAGDGYLFSDSAYYPSVVNNSYNVTILAPYEITVDNIIDQTSQVSGIITTGIKFNYIYADADNYSYNYACITGNGKFIVGTYVKAAGTSSQAALQSYTIDSSIKEDSTTNSLKLTQNASTAVFSVNNTVLCTLSISAPIIDSRVGLFSFEDTAATTFNVSTTYDNFTVYPID